MPDGSTVRAARPDRTTSLRRIIRASSVLLAAVVATPVVAPSAFAQFTNIFRDEPPRPPGDVPRAAPPPAGTFEPQQRSPSNQRPTFQTLRPPGGQQPAPGEWQNPDLLPQNQRAPASAVPGQPGVMPGGVQSQPLAPPPGAATGQPGQPAQPGQDQLRGSQDAGLPPGQWQPAQPAPAQQGGQQTPPAEAAPPNDEVVVRPPEQKIENPTAVFTGLDKITGRTITFDVAINETVQFGALQVTPRVCYTRPPTETPNTDAFVKVDEVTLQGDMKQIFSGWMFSASPGLNAVEHPIYDVWLKACKDKSSVPPPDAAKAN